MIPCGVHFSQIAWQSGANTSERIHQYSYNDYKPIVGTNFYRLKQLDLDGQFEYSNVVAIEYLKDNQISTLFPNLATNQITIDGWYSDEITTFKIMNVLGEVVQTIEHSTNTIDISGLAAGSYLIEWKAKSSLGFNTLPFIKR